MDRRSLWVGLVLGLLAAVAGAVWRSWSDVRAEIDPLVARHVRHEVAHPGWSFPARVWSAPASLDLPAARRVRHARARGYQEACPAELPGSFCPTDGAVVPRSGDAMEPVLLGWLVGPDGELREHLPLTEAPDLLVNTLIFAEDERFFSHFGVDPIGALRAALVNLRGGGYRQGASTLTMQLVRSWTARKERTAPRKLREAASAVAMDRALGKDGVLGAYLDLPYLGQDGPFSVCGFRAAARFYWDKEVGELTLGEAATLVSILPGPARWAPDRFPEEARRRRDGLLRRMGEDGIDVTAALAEPVSSTPKPLLPPERFVPYLHLVRTDLLATLPPEVVYGAGLDVHTALDVVSQTEGDAVLHERVRFLESVAGRRGPGPLTAAAVLVDAATGRVMAAHDTALLRSSDFGRVVMARRQPGSAFKPLTYALALGLRDGDGPRFTASSTVPNHWRRFEPSGWSPRNVGGRYSPTSTLADGVASSHNVATASLLELSGGPEALVKLAARVGFDTRNFPLELGLALGQAEVSVLEMARWVGVVSAGGRRVTASPVVSAVDASGRERWQPEASTEVVLDAGVAALVRELMGLVVTQGTGGAVRGRAGFAGYDGPIWGKTGTSDEEKDLWFVGGTPDVAGALWLGYDEPTRIGAAASDFSAPLFGWWMRAVHEGLPRRADFGGPVVEHRWICAETGRVPVEGCRGVNAPFLPGTAPTAGLCVGGHEAVDGGVESHQSLWDFQAP